MQTSVKTVAVVITAVALMVTGCSSDTNKDGAADSGNSAPVPVQPGTAAVSPETSTQPAGAVVEFSSRLNFTTFDPDSHTVAALTDDSSTLVIFDVAALQQTPRRLNLGGTAARIDKGVGGTVLLPMKDRVLRVDLAAGTTTSIPVSGDARSAAVLADGELAVGDAAGSIHIMDFAGNQSHLVSGLKQVDALASNTSGLTALDRSQTSLTTIDEQKWSLGIALRAGDGASELTTDHFGRILVTDTVGKSLLVYTTDALLLRQKFPVGDSPYGITYDDSSNVVWVSDTSDNEVIGFALDTGQPVEVARFPTVRQPDSISVDPSTGDVYVGSASGQGLQVIPARN